MPSGAKKRKAAKKKKENQNQTSNHSDSAAAHAHGEDDRESDVGEVSSPMSQDHQKPPMEDGDDKIEKDCEVSEKEIKIEDELGKKDGIIDFDDEANRASYDGGSSGSSGGSSSSSSCSDDEIHRIKKGQAESSIAAGGGDLVVESIPAAISEKITLSIEQVELDAPAPAPSPADITVPPHVIESTLKQDGKKKCCSVKERISISEPSENAASHEKGEANAQTAEACVTASQENDDRSTSPDIASTAAVDNAAQHLVAAPSPYPIQKTSWKGCCGLFEVFSSSGA